MAIAGGEVGQACEQAWTAQAVHDERHALVTVAMKGGRHNKPPVTACGGTEGETMRRVVLVGILRHPPKIAKLNFAPAYTVKVSTFRSRRV